MQLFPIDLKSPQCLKQKVILKTNQSDSDFPNALDTPQKLTLDIENSRGYPPCRSATAEAVNYLFTKKKFLQIPDLVNGPTAAPVAAENRR